MIIWKLITNQNTSNMKTNITAIRIYIDIDGQEETFIAFTNPETIIKIMTEVDFFKDIAKQNSKIQSPYT